MRIAKPALDSRSSLIQISEFSKNFGDVHEIMKFEKAREVLGSLSCLGLLSPLSQLGCLGFGCWVLGSRCWELNSTEQGADRRRWEFPGYTGLLVCSVLLAVWWI